MIISFTIPGKIRRNGYQDQIKMCFQECLKWNAIDKYEVSLKPFHVIISCYFQRPKIHYNTDGKLKANAPYYRTGKQGVGSIPKCMEALNGIVWKDSGQICRLTVEKQFSNTSNEYMEVMLKEFN